MVTVLGANTLSSGGYEVENSVKLFSNTLMTMTPSGAPTNADINTISFWCKLSALGSSQSPIAAAGNAAAFSFRSDHKLQFYNAGGTLRTDRLFRDVSAWYHVVVATDTTDGTANDRLKMYINGVQETSFTSRTNPNQNANTHLGSAVEHHIGCNTNAANFFNGYLAEVCFIDGTALLPTSFGEFDDNGIWRPKDVSSLTYGKNGFYLEFKSGGNLGDEDKGTQTADWSETNLTVVDQSLDTCTNNYCVMNPLDNLFSNATFSEGNLQYSSSRYASPTSTFGLTKGKWYFEIKCVSAAGTGGFVGITSATATATNFEFGNTGGGRAGYVYANNGGVYGNGGTLAGAGVFAEFGDDDNDLLMMAADLDNNKIYFGKNGTWGNSQNPVNGNNALTIVALSTQDSGVWRFGAMGETNNATIWQWNFGSPVHSIDSTQADDDGHGNFEYDVPAGYFALNSKNLAEYG